MIGINKKDDDDGIQLEFLAEAEDDEHEAEDDELEIAEQEELESNRGGEFSDDSFDAEDMRELAVNRVHWSSVEEANAFGVTRGLLKKVN